MSTCSVNEVRTLALITATHHERIIILEHIIILHNMLVLTSTDSVNTTHYNRPSWLQPTFELGRHRTGRSSLQRLVAGFQSISLSEAPNSTAASRSLWTNRNTRWRCNMTNSRHSINDFPCVEIQRVAIPQWLWQWRYSKVWLVLRPIWFTRGQGPFFCGKFCQIPQSNLWNSAALLSSHTQHSTASRRCCIN